MSVSITPPMFLQFFVSGTNQPAVGSQLFTYIAGTSTKQATWTDSTQLTQSANPIVADSNGVMIFWLDPTLQYKFVWAAKGDTDPPSSPIYSVDNISGMLTVGSLTQAILGPILYPRTAAEIAAGVTPVNFAPLPGAFRRYGMDPTGTVDSSGALLNAIAANAVVFDDYPGGGRYLINNTVALQSYLRISGQGKNISGTPGRGTVFLIGASVSVAALRATAFISDVEIDHITFTWANFTLNQKAIQFDVDARSIRIHDNACLGAAVNTTISTFLNFVGGGTFSGDVTIEKNYINAVQVAISLAGSCTTVRIVENEMYSNTVIPNSFGVNNVSTGGGGLIIDANTFEQWNKAINSTSGAIRITNNYFEANVTFDWSLGTSGNNYVRGNTYTGSALVSFVYNNTTANAIMDGGGAGYFVDSATFAAYRGFSELGLAANLGYYTDYTPTLGAGAGTLSATTITYAYYSRKGGEMTLHFNFSGTLGGAATNVLTVSTPGSIFPAKNTQVSCTVANAGANSFGLAYAQTSGAVINIGLGAGGSGNFTNGAVGGTGQITFRILS